MKPTGVWPLATALAALCLACAEPAPPEPTGPRLSAKSSELGLLLERLSRFENTPLGRAAAELAERLPDCAVVEARASEADLAALLGAVHCAAPEDAASSVLDGRDIGFAWPLDDGSTLRGRLEIDAWANAELELVLPEDAARGVAALVLPGQTPPGTGVLSATDTLLHARVRPVGGIDLARLVQADGQASQMFRLKSALFAGTVLDGTWEAAIYLPNDGEALPPLALAVGFTARAPAVAAMEQFVEELRETWGIARTDFSHGAADGACLPDLRILPEFSPCYVATERALVIGWNARSIARTLATGGERFGPQGGLNVALDRFGEADALLAASERLPESPPSPVLPWNQLRAVGRAEPDGVRLRLHLQAEPDA